MNWGYKLTIGMILFMGFIIYLSTRMMKSPTQTITEKYYEKGLHYEDRMELLRHGAENPPSINLYGSTLKLAFNKKVDSVRVILVRPQDIRNENAFTEAGPVDSCKFDLDALNQGRWKMTVEWSDPQAAALETDIVLP